MSNILINNLIVQGDTKNVNKKHRKTPKTLFRFTQIFRYIKLSLCSRHLQSFRSVSQKLIL